MASIPSSPPAPSAPVAPPTAPSYSVPTTWTDKTQKTFSPFFDALNQIDKKITDSDFSSLNSKTRKTEGAKILHVTSNYLLSLGEAIDKEDLPPPDWGLSDALYAVHDDVDLAQGIRRIASAAQSAISSIGDHFEGITKKCEAIAQRFAKISQHYGKHPRVKLEEMKKLLKPFFADKMQTLFRKRNPNSSSFIRTLEGIAHGLTFYSPLPSLAGSSAIPSLDESTAPNRQALEEAVSRIQDRYERKEAEKRTQDIANMARAAFAFANQLRAILDASSTVDWLSSGARLDTIKKINTLANQHLPALCNKHGIQLQALQAKTQNSSSAMPSAVPLLSVPLSISSFTPPHVPFQAPVSYVPVFPSIPSPLFNSPLPSFSVTSVYPSLHGGLQMPVAQLVPFPTMPVWPQNFSIVPSAPPSFVFVVPANNLTRREEQKETS